MGNNHHDEHEDDERDESFSPAEYEDMLLVERLESLEEDMEELGVATLAEVRQRIAELHRKLDLE